jgi:hypothetical protein
LIKINSAHAEEHDENESGDDQFEHISGLHPGARSADKDVRVHRVWAFM